MRWRVIVKGEFSELYGDEEAASKACEAYREEGKEAVMVEDSIKHPEGEINSKKASELWCPVCGEIREFTRNTTKRINTCDFCGLSEHHFWVRRINNLWKS